MNCDEAFEGLALAYWRMLDAIEKKVRIETADTLDILVEQHAQEIRRTCYPREKQIWEDAYVRVMSAMARADIEAGFEPFSVPGKPLRGSGAVLEYEQGEML